MISIICPQMPLLSTLFCICLCSFTLIWCRIISHWICVLVSVFVLASLPLLSKCVWLAKFLFGDYCFPSQRSEFSFVSLIFGHLFLSIALAFQFVLFYSGIQWCPQRHPDWAWAKKSRYLEWQTVTGVKIARAWLWDITLFCLPQSHTDSSFWRHGRGQGGQEVGQGSSTILPAPPVKAEGAALLSTNLSPLLSPSYFL